MQILKDMESLTKGKAVIPVEQQLAASANAAAKHSSELEKAAKAAGFKNADEWMAWNAQREKKRAPQTTTGAPKKAAASNPASGGVSSILNRITEALKGK